LRAGVRAGVAAAGQEEGEILGLGSGGEPDGGGGLRELGGELGAGVAGREGGERGAEVVGGAAAVAAGLFEAGTEGEHLRVLGVGVQAVAEPGLGVLGVAGGEGGADG